jgi:diguanylate cyclase (GGDEF)-like protein
LAFRVVCLLMGENVEQSFEADVEARTAAETEAEARSGEAPVGLQLQLLWLGCAGFLGLVGVGVSAYSFAASTSGAIPVLLVGLVLSVLLGVVTYLFGTGRARWRVLIDKRNHELEFQALHDSLTGLPNRALIIDRIDQLLARNRRNGTVGAALYIDLDDFKIVNDSLGHETGDQLLVAVASRLSSTLREADTIGRMGGDEFVVLIDGSDPMVAPELVAERLLDVMQEPFELEGSLTSLHANTSIGIAVGDRATGGELLRDADIALYKAKGEGKNRYEFFHPKMQSEIGRRIRLEFDLRSALAGDQFRLVYQPIYNLDDLSVVGVEALLRWAHPAEGLLGPDEFIPILEQTGQIREIGVWVLEQACKQMAVWHSRGDTLNLSVNISGRQLEDDRIVEHIRHALRSSGLPPAALIIEVTEGALMRDEAAAALRMRAIKDLGVSLAVDDFGTGYSSLAYLQQFPIDCIKIDKSFTNAMATSPESLTLVRTLVRLGQDLGLKTLAEGVETMGEMDVLRADRVNEAQGYLFAQPLDPEMFESHLLAPVRSIHIAPPDGG